MPGVSVGVGVSVRRRRGGGGITIPAALAYYTFDAGDTLSTPDGTGNGYTLSRVSASIGYSTTAAIGTRSWASGNLTGANLPISPSDPYTVQAWIFAGPFSSASVRLSGQNLIADGNANANTQIAGVSLGTNPPVAYRHTAVVHTGGGSFDVYHAGVFVATVTGVNTFTDFQLSLNKLAGSAVDEVGVWNVALTAPQIALLYNGGTGQRPPNVPAP